MKHAIDFKRARCYWGRPQNEPTIDTRLHRASEREPDPMWSNEGRKSEASRDTTERILRGPWGWLLIVVVAVVVALAFNGGAWR